MNQNISSGKALITNRIIWLALILGQVSFGVIIATVILPSHPPVRPQPVLVWVNLFLLVTEVPVMFVIRMLIFRRGTVDGRIRPAAFGTGNIVFWAGCEAVSFFGLIIVVLTGSWWPTIAIVGVALGLQAITFPVGGRLDGA
jgi:hypothetical protein